MISLIIDCETTGLNPVCDRVVELGFVMTDWSQIMCAISSYVNPEMEFDNAVNGLTHLSVKHAPKFGELLPFSYMLLLYADEYIAYNWTFDAGFLREELARCGLKLPSRQVFDPFRSVGKMKLHDACAKHNVYTDDIHWHSALDDAVATFRLAKQLRGSPTMQSLAATGREASLIPRF